MEYAELRKQYPEFIYEGYWIEETPSQIRITYDFAITGMAAHFHPAWSWDCCNALHFDASSPVVRKLVFSLGMTELISYWKCACPPRVLVRAGELDEAQLAWWKKLYFNGLGEFFYTNGLTPDIDGFMELVCEPKAEYCDAAYGGKAEEPVFYRERVLEGALIPVGGGKDSVVTMDLLKHCTGNAAYCINSRGATEGCIRMAGYEGENVVNVHRTLDAYLLQLNREGYLNGHTPFSAIVAFSSVLTAYIYGKKYVVLSNESSANESTVRNSHVNHQYSKSFEFERDFYHYMTEYIAAGVHYFSMLRPLSEYQIARLFADCTPFHSVFKSCNAGSKQDIWCCHCPKCMFVFMILSPFLSIQALTDIFGENMLENPAMRATMQELTGVVENKPFECVGSRDEVNAAVCRCIRRLNAAGEALPLLYEEYYHSPLYRQYEHASDYYEKYYDSAHLIPPELEVLLKERLRAVCWDTWENE